MGSNVRLSLRVAVMRGDLKTVKYIFDHQGWDANAHVDQAGETTPLHIACKNGHNEIVSYLLQKGADVNARDWNGDTALHASVSQRHVPTVALLLEHGADPRKENDDGETPLDLLALNEPANDPRRVQILGLFAEYYPGLTLESVVNLSGDESGKEEILEWYREHHPEMVMGRYCTGELLP